MKHQTVFSINLNGGHRKCHNERNIPWRKIDRSSDRTKVLILVFISQFEFKVLHFVPSDTIKLIMIIIKIIIFIIINIIHLNLDFTRWQ